MAKKRSIFKILIALLKVTISFLILFWLFNKAQQDNQFAEIVARQKNWIWLAIGFAFCIAAHLVSFVRWNLLVRALEIPFYLTDAIRIGLIGLFFGLFAFGVVGGDSLRMFYAARRAKLKLTQIVCSVFADRLIGMLTMFTFATIGFLLVETGDGNFASPEKLSAITKLCWFVTTLTVIGWIGVLTVFASPPVASKKLFELLNSIPRIGGLFEKLESVVELYRSRIPVIIISFLMSAVVNLCFILTIYCIAVGLNVVHPSLAQHAVIAPISMTANALPLPGGLGGMEWVLAFFYEALSTTGQQSEFGIVVAFTFRLTLLALSASGAFAWFINRKQIQQVVDAQHNDSQD